MALTYDGLPKANRPSTSTNSFASLPDADGKRVDASSDPNHLKRTSSEPTTAQEFSAIHRPSVDSSSPSPNQAALRDAESLARVTSGPPYSAFSLSTRLWITAIVTISNVISPMTASIYFPALDELARSLNVSILLIYFTITTYMVFQGLAPTIFGDFGDMAGRRPAFFLSFIIYFFANIGLALQRNYTALLILRSLQSAGSSGTLALGYAVIADIASSSERGRYMGIAGAGANFGPAIGPVLGGLLSEYLGWPSIFWFCAIFVALWLIPWTLAVPETCRAVVGDGSIPPPRWNMTLIDFVRCRGAVVRPESAPRLKLRFPNPLRTLYIVFRKEESIILIVSAIIYLNFILVSATLSTSFKRIYRYNNVQVGLCFLPYGVGCCIMSVVQGYILDWNYRRIAKKLNMPLSRKHVGDIGSFPIETARLQPIYPALALGTAALIGWGWSLHAETNVAIPLVLLFIIGILVPPSYSVLNTLLVDLNPEAPATAAAANNLLRCTLGALGTAVIGYMIQAMGRGWIFTLLASVMALGLIALRVLELQGPRWRAERADKVARVAKANGQKGQLDLGDVLE